MDRYAEIVGQKFRWRVSRRGQHLLGDRIVTVTEVETDLVTGEAWFHLDQKGFFPLSEEDFRRLFEPL